MGLGMELPGYTDHNGGTMYHVETDKIKNSLRRAYMSNSVLTTAGFLLFLSGLRLQLLAEA